MAQRDSIPSGTFRSEPSPPIPAISCAWWQAGHRRVWVLLTLPRDMRLRFPDLTRVIETDFEPVARFRGTLGDGDVYLVRSRGLSAP